MVYYYPEILKKYITSQNNYAKSSDNVKKGAKQENKNKKR